MKQQYSTYKSTKTDWLKQIPEQWDCVRIGSVFIERTETVSDKDFAPLSVTMQGIVPQLDTAAKTDNGDNRKKVCKGDFVINSRSDRKGSGGVSPTDGSVSVISTVLKPRIGVYAGYVNYLLTNYYFQEEFYRYGKGIVADLWSTKYSSMKTMYIPVPPLPEQTAIANYLDVQNNKINLFINKKLKLIELLKEQKQAIVNEQLLMVNEKWRSWKLKFVVSKVGGGVTPSGGGTTYLNKGIPLLRSQNVYSDELVLDDVAFISEETHNSMSGSKVKEGDVLLNITGGSLGRCFYATESLGEANINQHISIIRPKQQKISTLFLHLLLVSEMGQKQMVFGQTGGNREGLSAFAIKNFKFPLPPLEIQQQIVNNAQVETSKIDNAIKTIEKEIELIREYKQSLVAEAVTGKIKVA